MIPKVIHYLWLGDEKPSLEKRCIKSWKRFCPDWEIIEWNESNYDVYMTDFSKEAYDLKKWGFVADPFRFWVLYEYGGFYLDTYTELIKSLDSLTGFKTFFGFENSSKILTGIEGTEKNCGVFERIFNYYTKAHFLLSDGTIDATPSPVVITKILKQYGLVENNKYQMLESEIHIFPSDYFSPKDGGTRIIKLTPNTYAIHHFSASWVSGKYKILLRISWGMKRIVWYIEKLFKINGLYDQLTKLIAKLNIKIN